jgi:hypothetical protein
VDQRVALALLAQEGDRASVDERQSEGHAAQLHTGRSPRDSSLVVIR